MCDLDFADRLNDSGFTLSVEEKAGLQAAMLQRKLEENFSVFQFWGKIFGKQNDYIICFGLTSSYDHPTKKFYFTNANKIILQQLPEMSEDDTDRASRVSGMFEGDPSFPLEGGEAAEGEEAAPLSELHRLAATVAAIDADTATVPRGAWIVSPTHEVVKNVAYTGLNFEAAQQLSSYYHFRAAKNPQTVENLQKPGMVRNSDFLDSLASDAPTGTWSVQLSGSRTAVSVRSLKWPGYFFFHTVDTPFFGGAYFGHGQANTDLAFSK